MKTLKTVFFILALANLFAILMLVGWLYSSKRINTDRLIAVRDMLGETISEEQLRLEQEQAEADAAAQQEAVMERFSGDPVSAEGHVTLQLSNYEVDQQVTSRTEREVHDLGRTLIDERAKLDRERAELQAQREAFEKRLKQIDETRGSEQFQKTVDTLQGQRPKHAKSVLLEMWNTRRQDEVIALLDAMDDRPRNKIMAEFAKDDAALTASILEALRDQGLLPTPESQNQASLP